MGIKCDKCRDDPNVGLNSNLLAELDLGAEVRGDSCDPVPILRLDTRRTKSEFPFVPVPLLGKDDVEDLWFRGKSFLGWGAVSEKITQPIGFRFCNCYDKNMELLSQEDCLKDRLCRPRDAHYGVAEWKIIDVDHISAGNLRVLVPGDVGGAPQEFTRVRGNPLKDRPGAETEFVCTVFPLSRLTLLAS